MAQAKKGNFIVRLISFSKEAYEELKKVHAPSRADTVRTTMGVLFMVVAFGLFLGFADFIIGTVMRTVLTKG